MQIIYIKLLYIIYINQHLIMTILSQFEHVSYINLNLKFTIIFILVSNKGQPLAV